MQIHDDSDPNRSESMLMFYYTLIDEHSQWCDTLSDTKLESPPSLILIAR